MISMILDEGLAVASTPDSENGPAALKRSLLITIDGPAGAGKTTVSRRLAARLGYHYIDTGALYRGLAYAVKTAGVDYRDADALTKLFKDTHLRFRAAADGVHLLLNGVDITAHIRTPEMTMLASAVSAEAAARRFLLDLQRGMGAEKKAVFEGRDMGTIVFPAADVKFFLDAAAEVRAYRRYLETAAEGPQTLADVTADMHKRDQNDMRRKLAPLKPAEDAVRIDATGMDVEAVVAAMMAVVAEKCGA